MLIGYGVPIEALVADWIWFHTRREKLNVDDMLFWWFYDRHGFSGFSFIIMSYSIMKCILAIFMWELEQHYDMRDKIKHIRVQ